MIGIVLTGHGSFPTGMLESVKLIAGDIKQIRVVPFEEDQEILQNDLLAAIDEVDTGDGVVCFADLAGGTPFNISSRIAADKASVRVIGGVNSPMLLSSLFQRDLELDSFVQAAIQEGKENIKPFGKPKKETIETEDGI